MSYPPIITPAGIQIPTVEGLLARISTRQKALIDPLLNTDPDSPMGQNNGLFAELLREAYEALLDAYNGFDPDNAEGRLMVALAALTGTTPAAAVPSRFFGDRRLRLTLDADKTVPIGTVFHVLNNPSVRFSTTEDVISTTAGDYLVSAECTETGPTVCLAGTLVVIATPIVGLNAVVNDYDAVLGSLADNDFTLRIRRINELRAQGLGTPEAIRARLQAVRLPDNSAPIVTAKVIENTSSTPDVITGLPGHSMECLVFDGIPPACPNDTIARAIWEAKGGGSELVGSSSGVAIDSNGDTQTILFTRPTVVGFQIVAHLEVDAGVYAGDAAAQLAIKNAFVEHVAPGRTVRLNDYRSALSLVPGVLDVLTLQMSKLGSPLGTSNIPLDIREMGDIDTADILITTENGTP